jgi:hypothetical protein
MQVKKVKALLEIASQISQATASQIDLEDTLQPDVIRTSVCVLKKYLRAILEELEFQEKNEQLARDVMYS